MSSSSATRQNPSLENIRTACSSIGYHLSDSKYAIVGGAACQLLGSTRTTEDVDFVVLKGEVRGARKLLAADKDRFVVEPRTLHTYFKTTPPVEIEILSPPGTFKENFDQNTPTITVNVDDSPVSVLHPMLILNAKCRSVLGRPSDDKKRSDAFDIKYLLRYLANAGTILDSKYLPNVTKEFVEWFVASYGDEEVWRNAKYDLATDLQAATNEDGFDLEKEFDRVMKIGEEVIVQIAQSWLEGTATVYDESSSMPRNTTRNTRVPCARF